MKRTALFTVAAALAAAVAAGSFWLGRLQGMATPAAQASAGPGNESSEDATRRHIAKGIKAGDTDPANGKRILYYHDPMVPGNKFDKPAKSPFMDMMLYPVYADGGDGDAGKVAVSPRMQQSLGIRTVVVAEGFLSPQVSAVGSIAWNERDQVVVQARATGFVERLHVRATLDRVAAGQPLAEVYVPDWVAAQEEYLALRRQPGGDLAGLIAAARQRMRQAGMAEPQIALVESSNQPQVRATVVAPAAGLISELLVREGMTVMAGATLFRINGTGTVWANAELPESQAALLRPGTRVRATSPATPGTTYEGRMQALLPEVNPATRTLKARVELANPGGRLAPGAFVQMQFIDPKQAKSLLIPSESVIQTGKRTVVMLAEENGRFRPLEIEAGLESGGQTQVRRGLRVGQRVVASSQFLIDSEASLRGMEARLNNTPSADGTSGKAAAAPRHEGEARIERMAGDAITLTHGPIPSIKWGAMTMDFKPPAGGAAKLPRGLAVGDRVGFEFFMDTDDQPQLTRLSLLPPANQPTGAASGSKR